jgi:hypothetical protein
MEETRLTSSVANLDVEIVRRDYPEDNAEVMTIRLRATPSFEAVSRSLMSPFSSPFPFNPLLAWAHMVQAAWSPLLSAMAPRVQTAGEPEAPRIREAANRSEPGQS